MQINTSALKMAAVVTGVTLVTYFTLNTLFPRKDLHDLDIETTGYTQPAAKSESGTDNRETPVSENDKAETMPDHEQVREIAAKAAREAARQSARETAERVAREVVETALADQ